MTDGIKLIVSSIRKKDISHITKIQEDWWDDLEFDIYRVVKNYYADYKKLPPLRVLSSEFPTVKFDFDEAAAEPKFYATKIFERHIYVSIAEVLPKISKTVRDDPRKALSDINKLIQRDTLRETNSKSTTQHESALDRFDKYEERKHSGGILYRSTGSKLMDELTYGYQVSDVWTFAARSGIGKTFLLIYLALLAEDALPDTDNEILFVTNEMPIEEINERSDAIRFGVPYGDLLGGNLTPFMEKKYHEGLKNMSEKNSRIRMVQNVRSTEELDSLVAMYNPPIVYVDGSYLMNRHLKLATWERVESVTSDFKAIGLSSGKPIVNTTQLKRSSGKESSEFSLDAQEEFAFGGSFINDSDLAVSAYQNAQMKYRDEVGLQFAKGRRMDITRKFFWRFCLSDMLFDLYEQDFDIEEDTVTL